MDLGQICMHFNLYILKNAGMIFFPQAYRKFTDKHMKEGKEYMKPAEPHMCVMTMITVRTLHCKWHCISPIYRFN